MSYCNTFINFANACPKSGRKTRFHLIGMKNSRLGPQIAKPSESLKENTNLT